MKAYDSIVNEGVLKEFAEPLGKTLMNHAFNVCKIENYLSIAAVLWPKIVKVEGCYFIAEFYNGNIENLRREHNDNKQEIEKFVNSWALEDFFLLYARDASLDNDNIYAEFCKVIKFFWTLRFKELFPGVKMKIEVLDNFMGESGKTITVYQEG